MTDYKAERARLKELKKSTTPMLWLLGRLNATRIVTSEKPHKIGKHARRAKLCAEYGVPNTGRQWRKLRQTVPPSELE